MPSFSACMILIIFSPRNLFGHLFIAFWEGLVQLQLEWPQSPHLVLLQLCPLRGGEVSQAKGMCTPRGHASSPRPPHPGSWNFIPGLFELLPQGHPSKNRLHQQGPRPAAPEGAKGRGSELAHMGWHVQMCAQSFLW